MHLGPRIRTLRLLCGLRYVSEPSWGEGQARGSPPDKNQLGTRHRWGLQGRRRPSA